MKIVHLSSSDINGGAAKAAYEIHKALTANYINSQMLVQEKLSNDDRIKSIKTNNKTKLAYSLRYLADYFSIKIFTKEAMGRFSFPFWGVDLSRHDLLVHSDIIQMHWINQAFLSIDNIMQIIYMNKPVIWTLHDMWAFTGGCHYSGKCVKFLKNCYECPCLKFPCKNDFSKKIFIQKQLTFQNTNFSIITSSKWLAKEASRSFLFKDKRIEVIPAPVNIDVYKPINKKLTREKLNIHMDKIIIQFGTMTLSEERKGYFYLKECLKSLYYKTPHLRENVEILVFGKSDDEKFKEIPFKIISLGRIRGDENLALAYNVADIFVAPSLQDNLPNTVLESLSCGIPVVAFNIGGMPDMIEHKHNGYLAHPFDIEDLVNGILWILNNPDTNQLKENARNKIVNNFSYKKIAEYYSSFYDSLL